MLAIEDTMDSKTNKNRRTRRTFTKEFKAEAARLCRTGDRSVGQVARDLDLNVASLHNWLRQFDIDAGNNPSDALTSSERDELTRLRRDNRRLQMEREILKKAAAFFAKEGK
jgi:transposase